MKKVLSGQGIRKFWQFPTLKANWLGWAIALAMLAGSGGCWGGNSQSITIDGSSTVYPVNEAVAEEFGKKHSLVRVTVGISGTGGGFKKFTAGTIDICGASRPIKKVEKDRCTKAGVEYITLEVAFDGLAVVVNPENDWCDKLSVAQLKELWRPGSAVKKWSDLNPKWPAKKIKLYGPGTDSGTFDYFTESIVGKAGASRPDYTASEDDNVLVTGVQQDPNALGYFGFAYYVENKSKLKLLSVDNGSQTVKPSIDTVRDGSYSPLSRPLFIYVRKVSLEKTLVRDFVRFYLDNCKKLAQEVGYVPISDDAAQKNERAFKATEATKQVGPKGQNDKKDSSKKDSSK